MHKKCSKPAINRAQSSTTWALINKASPKDDFPLLHIDMLVDNIVGHSMLSFMDGFSNYN